MHAVFMATLVVLGWFVWMNGRREASTGVVN
jgi:hypothetical protein